MERCKGEKLGKRVDGDLERSYDGKEKKLSDGKWKHEKWRDRMIKRLKDGMRENEKKSKET